MLNIIVLEVPKYESLCLSAMAFLTRTASDHQILKMRLYQVSDYVDDSVKGKLGRGWEKIPLNKVEPPDRTIF